MHLIIPIGPILFACLLTLHTSISAQQDTSNSVSDSILLRVESHPVLLYATRDILPYTVSQISQKAIQRLPEPTIEPLLNATPGLWMQSGTLNTNRISIRGVGYREPFATTGIKIYLDEIPLTNGAGEASIEDIHPNILAGIEILRGPTSAFWGAGLGGMILLKSAIPEEDEWIGKIQAGAFGRMQIDQHLSTRYGDEDQFGTVLHYQYLNDDGYRENNSYRKYSMTWIQQWRNTRGWSLQSFLHTIALKAYIPSSITLSAYETEPESAAPTWAMVQGNEDYTKWISGLTMSYTSPKNLVYRGSVFGTWFSSDEVRPFNVLEESNGSYGTRHRLAWQVHRNGYITAGAEFYGERYNASTFETLSGGVRGMPLTNERDHRSYVHAFCQSEWKVLKEGNVFAGLSSAWSRLTNRDVSTKVPVSVFPTVGVQYRITHALSASASLSRGYTALLLSDLLNSDGEIQSDIVPETGWNKEVALMVNPHKSITFRITGYSMLIRNTIITRRIQDDQFEKYNGGQTRHRGIEFESQVTGRNEEWMWTAAYTFNDHIFSDFDDGGVDFSGKQLPGVPVHRLYQQFRMDVIANLFVSLSHHWVSAVYLDDANAQRGSGYHLVNGSIDYSFYTGSNLKWIVTTHVHNLWDVRYSPMFQINAPGTMPRYYYPGKPRSVYVSVGFEYKIRK